MLEDVNSWGINVNKYVTEHRKVVPKSFISKMDPGRILTLIEQSNTENIEAFRYAINNLSNYISNENEEVDYGKLLQLTNIKEENIKTTISFDFIITLTTNRKYQTNIQIDIPAKEVIEKGVDGIELTEFNNLIFKRIEN